MQEQQHHQVIIDNRKSIRVTAVDGVLAFNESKISLGLLGGNKLTVTGNGLKIVGFSKEEGTFFATGEVAGILYGGKNLLQKLLK